MDNDLTKCGVCEYRCEIAPGAVGVCRMRSNHNGTLYAHNYGLISRADLGLIESRNFYHFFPGAKIFSLGGYGLNFPMLNGQEAFAEIPTSTNPRSLPIDRISRFAIEHLCRGVIFAYSEPTIWYEYLVDACKSVRANGLFTAIVTNGYITPEALQPVGHYIDGLLVEVNAFSERTFNILTNQSKYQKVLETILRARLEYNAHIEISTNLVPGVNDEENEIKALASWIKQELGENTAWHLFCAVPHSDNVLREVKQTAEDMGLNYIYAHGMSPVTEIDESAAALFDCTVNGNTYCYKCRKIVVNRRDGEITTFGLDNNKCAHCGTVLGIRNTLWKL